MHREFGGSGRFLCLAANNLGIVGPEWAATGFVGPNVHANIQVVFPQTVRLGEEAVPQMKAIFRMTNAPKATKPLNENKFQQERLMSRKRWWMAGAAALTAVAMAPFVYSVIVDQPLTDEVKTQAPGKFADLPDGAVHYQWFEAAAGKANGEIVVMLHGLYVPGFMFSALARDFSAAGYRVLLMDHYGHGFSDRPDTTYDAALFDREIDGLLDATGVDQPVHLMGQSMGSMIAAHYASTHPQRVRDLTLMVPAGLKLRWAEDDTTAQLLEVPGVGEWIWQVYGRMAMANPQPSPCTACGEGKLEGDIRVQAHYSGFYPAMLSIIRNFPLRNGDETYVNLEKTGVRTMAIFGDQDDTVDIESADRLAKAAPDTDIRILHNVDHEVQFRRPELVAPMILEFIGSTAATVDAVAAAPSSAKS